MQIRDMLGQYSQNVKNGTEELMSAQGTQKLVSSMQELEPGSTFEGTVNSVKNGKVVLALGNGQTITARLDGKVSIQPGESMFFQVRSNDGTTIALRPYVQAGNINNPILLNALTAAGVPATERNITMVDSMMKEQMSISRQSILDMGRVVGSNPNVNVNTAVLMTKIGLPVSAEMASQFENYMVDQHAIVDEMDLAMNQLGRLLGDADLGEEQSFELYGKVLDILNGEGETPAQTTDGLQQNDTGTMVNAGENIEMEAAVQQSKNGAAAQGVQKQVQQQIPYFQTALSFRQIHTPDSVLTHHEAYSGNLPPSWTALMSLPVLPVQVQMLSYLHRPPTLCPQIHLPLPALQKDLYFR